MHTFKKLISRTILARDISDTAPPALSCASDIADVPAVYLAVVREAFSLPSPTEINNKQTFSCS